MAPDRLNCFGEVLENHATGHKKQVEIDQDPFSRHTAQPSMQTEAAQKLITASLITGKMKIANLVKKLPLEPAGLEAGRLLPFFQILQIQRAEEDLGIFVALSEQRAAEDQIRLPIFKDQAHHVLEAIAADIDIPRK